MMEKLLAFIVAGSMITWGFYGIIKKKMFAPWALSAKGKYEILAAKNIPPSEQYNFKHYLIYGLWAIIEGIILVMIGVTFIIVIIADLL